MVTSDYSIELRNKDGNLKQYLTPFVSNVSWEWNRIGGCGRCSITIHKPYRDIIFDARDDIQIRVPNLDKNLLANPNFENWSAGTATAPDGWTILSSGSSSVAREASIIKIGTYSASIVLSGGVYIFLTQEIHVTKGIAYWKGRTLTFGCWVYATVAAKTRIQIGDGVDNSYSSYHPGDSAWHFLTITHTVNSSATTVIVACRLGDNGDGTAYFDGAICVEGESISGAVIVPRSKLVYRGYIANIIPTLKTDQDIVLDVRGYFDLLKKVIVQTTGNKRTYTSKTVAYIADDIADTFIVTNTPITIERPIVDGDFSIDTIDFLCTVENALDTLSQLQGDIEYGVDEDLVFFWRTESTVINHRFFVGNNVSILERRVNWDELVNKVYLIGGDIAGTTYKVTGENTDSQALYYLTENIINNSSITTASVANQYIGAILTEKSNPQFSIRAEIANTPLRLEDDIPIGLVSFYDAAYDNVSLGDLIGDIIGELASSGSDITIGLLTDTDPNPPNETHGSGVTIGGQYSAQVNRISYKLSNTAGRFNIEVQLGDTVLETAAKIKRLEMALSSINQGV